MRAFRAPSQGHPGDRSGSVRGEPVGVTTGRLEAFSDGVIAVAITLLVLNIGVPSLAATKRYGLARALLRDWPVYAAYVTSFLTIGIIWINHHVMIRRLREPDHMILFLNLLLLMSIAVLPFATSLMAAYLKESEGQHLAAAIYSGAFLVMAVFFAALNRHILLVKPHRLREELPLDAPPADPRPQRQRRDPLRDRHRAGSGLAVRHARDLRRARRVLRVPDRQRRNGRRIARAARSVPPPRAEHAPPVVPRDRRAPRPR